MSKRIRARRAWGVSVLTATAAVVLIAILGSAGGGVAGARTAPLAAVSAKLAPTSPTIPATQTCDSIASLPSLAGLPKYPTAIASATVVAASSSNPKYCDVKGMIAPQTHFELQLPTKTWQGRYLQNGCGGYCGTVSNQTFPSCDAKLGGDFAMATDDEGHVTAAGLGGSGLFAFNDKKLRLEYGYQSEQALYVVARTIIDYYYGQPPQRSYYNGCSDGGREAMEMAERYPDDFDGIIAGAPEIIAGPLNAEEQTWNVRVNTDANGNAILTDDKLPALHDAVIAACGNDDGVPGGDGIITDPQNCNFDPASIQCKGADAPSCLTPAQVDVVRKFYAGPSDPQGQLLYPGGVPYGSELGWSVFELPPSQHGGSVPTTQSLDYYGLSLPYLRYQLLPIGQLGPDPFQWKFDDARFHSMFPTANIWDAMDANLSAFRRHGGKLIMWQGAADNGIPPSGTIDYYDVLTRQMGGPAATERLARLFMVPSVYHCGGSYAGASVPDMIYPMVQWVEDGAAPSQLTVQYGTTMTRPVYPYPLIPHYDGSGDPNDAANFRPVASRGAHYTDWIGNYLFYRPVGR